MRFDHLYFPHIFSLLFISQTILHTNRRLFTQQLISSLNIFMCEGLFVDSVYIIVMIIALNWASFSSPSSSSSCVRQPYVSMYKSTWTNYNENGSSFLKKKQYSFIHPYRKMRLIRIVSSYLSFHRIHFKRRMMSRLQYVCAHFILILSIVEHFMHRIFAYIDRSQWMSTCVCVCV